MELAGRLGGIGNVLTAGFNLYQNQDLSNKAQAIEQSRHEQELELMRQQHHNELITAKQTYLISTFTDIEQYCQELNENLVNSTKDAERDMVGQRSQQFQTILLAGTIMITSVVNVLIQGPLPVTADAFSKIAYSLSNTGSIIFIGMNMLLCIQLIYRVTQFMYRRSEANLSHLSDAMNETRTMMSHIRGDNDDGTGRNVARESAESSDMSYSRNLSSVPSGRYTFDENDANENNEEKMEDDGDKNQPSRTDAGYFDAEGIDRASKPPPLHPYRLQRKQHSSGAPAASYGGKSSSSSNSGSMSKSSNSFLNLAEENKKQQEWQTQQQHQHQQNLPNGLHKQTSTRSRISTLTHDEVDAQWRQHETEVHTYLHRRSAINERREVLRFGVVSFENFWNQSCRDSGFWALIFFYVGTSLMLLALMVFIWNLYIHIYNCISGAIVGVITIGISMIACIGFAVYLRFFDPTINHMREDSNALTARDGDVGIKYD
jgi:hypothetical protein